MKTSLELHAYPIVNLPDLLRRLYNGLEYVKTGREKGSIPESIEKIQLEYSNPLKNLPKEEKKHFLKFLFGEEEKPGYFLGSSKAQYLFYLGKKLPKDSKTFSADRRICEDFGKKFLLYEHTGILERVIVEDLFVPEFSKTYLSYCDYELPDNVLESNLIGAEGTVLGSVINLMLEEECKGYIRAGIIARPMWTSLICYEDEQGKLHGIYPGGLRHLNNFIISYGVLFNKSLIRHSTPLPVPSLENSLTYAMEMNYDGVISLLAESGLHEWYHILGLGHHTNNNKCVMDTVYDDPFEEPRFELCDFCKIKGLMGAEKLLERKGAEKMKVIGE